MSMKRLMVVFALIALMAAPAVLACGGKDAGMTASAEHKCPASMSGVERSVANVDNGVRLQLTSSDPEVVRSIQNMMADKGHAGCCKDCPLANTAWNRKAENIENGVVLTLTAASPDEVSKLQTSMASVAKGGCGHEGAAGKTGCPHKGGAKATKA